jgi:hypothetical protein
MSLCFLSMLYVHIACPFSMSMLHSHASCPVYVSS